MNRTRRTVSALAVVGALLWTVVAFAQALPSGATPKTGSRPRLAGQSVDPNASPFVTVTADKTTNLHDGDTIHFTVTPRPGVHVDALTAGVGIVQECAGSATATPADWLDHTKCPVNTVQSPAMPQALQFFYWYPDGSKAIGSVVVGVGDAVNPDDNNQVVTCDSTHPCRLMLQGQLNANISSQWFDASTLLTFAPVTNVVAGCNGVSPNPVPSIGPDRLANVWSKWASSQCSAGTTSGGKQSTTISFPVGGEAAGLDSFSQGSADLAYSAVGPDTAGFTPSKSRPWVAIPIALDASVMAVAGGHASSSSNPVPGVPLLMPQPFDTVQLTIPDIAELVSRGPTYSTITGQPGEDILKRNPQLGNTCCGTLDQTQKVFAPAGPNSITLFSTSAFVSRAAPEWRSPGPDGDQPRHVVTDFALEKNPPFTSFSTTTYSSRSDLFSGLFKALANVFNSQDHVHEVFALTDLASANHYAYPAAQAQTGKGDFVAPTAASIQAAVPTMETAKDGMLRPNPSASADRAGAYPLSFVEYAIAPSQPLVNGTCTLKTAEQTQLNNWLTYITTGGQSNLADGLVPLTPALKQQAAAAIAKVGKSPTTGACKGKVKAPNGKPVGGPNGGKGAGGGAGGFGAGGAGGFGAGGAAGGLGANGAGLDNAGLGGSGLGGTSANPSAETSAGALGAHATKPSTAASRRKAQQAADNASIKMPSFLGATPVSALIPPVSLLLITLITYLAGLGTSGRPVELPQFGRRRRQAADGPRLGWLRRLPSAQ